METRAIVSMTEALFFKTTTEGIWKLRLTSCPVRSAPLQVRTGEGRRDASSELRAARVCGAPDAAAVRHVSHLAVTAGRGCSGQADSSEAEANTKDPSISAGPLQHERRLLLPLFFLFYAAKNSLSLSLCVAGVLSGLSTSGQGGGEWGETVNVWARVTTSANLQRFNDGKLDLTFGGNQPLLSFLNLLNSHGSFSHFLFTHQSPPAYVLFLVKGTRLWGKVKWSLTCFKCLYCRRHS